MMSNWETVLEMQQAYNDGMTIGSAEKENAKYLDSVNGKINVLKENLKQLVTNVLSSDMTKGLLDIGINLTNGLVGISNFVNDIGASVPVTIGLITSLVQVIRTFGSDGKSMPNLGASLIKGISSAKGVVTGFNKATNTTSISLKNVDKSAKSVKTGVTSSGIAFKVASASAGTLSTNVNKLKDGNIKLATSAKTTNSTLRATTSSSNSFAFSLKKSVIGQSVMTAGLGLLNGALVSLGAYAISGVISWLDKLNRKYEIASEKNRGNIETARAEVQSLENKKKSLEAIAEEYDKLTNKSNKSTSEMERFKELGNEIAQIMPELVVGYDENNDPILKLNGSAKDLISSLDMAIDKQKNLIQNNQIELGKNALKDLNKTGFFSGQKHTKDDNKWAVYVGKIDTAQNKVLNSLDKLGTQSEEKYKNQLSKTKQYWEDYSNTIVEGASQVDTEYAKIETSMNEVRTGVNQQLDKNFRIKNTFNGMSEEISTELKSFSQNLVSSLDFSGLSDANVSTFVRNVEKALSDGKIDDSLQKYIKAREELERTGQYEEYEKTVSKLTPQLSKVLGLNEEMVKSMTEVPPVFKSAQSELDKYLMTFGKREQMIGFDIDTQKLASKFDIISTTLEDLLNDANMTTIDGKFQLDPEIEFSKDLPSEVQKLISEFKSSEGYISQEEVNVLIDVMSALRLGKTEEGKDLLEEVQTEIDKMLGKKTVKVTDIDVTADIKFSADLEKALNSFREDKSTKLLIEVVGEEKARLYSEIVEKLKTTPELTNRLILENQDALQNMTSYKEVVTWLKENPDIVSNYEIKGIEKLEKAKETQDKIDGKETTSKHTVLEEGVDEVAEKVENLDKTVESTDGKTVNVQANESNILETIEDIETLIQLSAKVEDGKYKLEIDATTEQAVLALTDLEIALKKLSNLMTNSTLSAEVSIETAQSAKNISGLITRIEQAKNTIQSLKSTSIKINTAQSAKNLSGLIVRVKQYTTAIEEVVSKDININTAQSAKNVSGLIRKLGDYNTTSGKLKPITFKTNANTVASQVANLTNQIKKVPTNKTSTLSVVTKYSSQGTPSAKVGGRGVARGVDYTGSENSSPSEQVQTETLGMQLMTRNAEMTPYTGKTILPRVSSIARGLSPNKVMPMFDFDIDVFKHLEDAIKRISNELSILGKKANLAFGKEKEEHLRKQIELLKKQQELQHLLAEDARIQQNELKYYLSQKGFFFDIDGKITNYSEKLLAYERHLESINNKLKKDPENDSLKSSYDATKEDLDKIKKALQSYSEVTFTDIPKCSEEWWSLQEQIENTTLEMTKAKDALQNLQFDLKIGQLELQLKKIRTELKKLDREIDNAYGEQKENLINQKIEALKKEQNQLHLLANQYREQAKVIGQFLSNQGFTIQSDGYIDMSHLETLVDNPMYDYIYDRLQEYIDLTTEKIPELSEEWWELQSSIEDCNDEIEQAKKELQQLIDEAKVTVLTDKFKDLQHEINMVEKALEHANGTDKLELLEKKIDLLKKQQAELNKQYEFYSSKQNELKGQLEGFGFTFDSSGDITNYVSQLSQLANTSKDFEEIKEIVEEYLDIQDEKLPSLKEDWMDLNNAVKDALKDQLETTKSIEDKITEVYKKQIEERKKLIDNELKHKLDALQKEKDAYNNARKEADYKKDFEEQSSIITDLENQIEIASKDTSLSGQKRLQELLKQLKEEQKKLQEMVQNKIDDQVNDMFDKESERLEEEANSAKEDLDEKYSDEKLQQIVKDTLTSGIFVGIDGEIKDLQETLLEFEDKFGDGMTAIGAIVKDELVGNLNIAKETMKDLAKIIDELGLEKYTTSAVNSTTPRSRISTGQPQKSSSPVINFNSELIRIDGNVEEDMLPLLKEMVEEAKTEIVDEIVRHIQ